MQQTIALSAAAGIAAAILFGVLTPGSMLFAPLMFLSPAPLLFVGIGWHPLVAALGALIACIGISLAMGSKLALSFAVTVGLPAWLIAAGLSRLMQTMPAGTPPHRAGRVIGFYLICGIAAYAALAMLIGALAIDTSYTQFQARLTAAVQRLLQDFVRGTPDAPLDAASAAQVARLFVGIFVPMSAIVIATMLTFSLWAAIRGLMRNDRLPFTPLPAYTLNLPKEAVLLLAGALLLAQTSGYTGLIGASLSATLAFVMMLNGLALIHDKTRGSASRTLILWVVWGTLIFFAPAALLYSLVGLADALFDFRRDGGPSLPSI